MASLDPNPADPRISQETRAEIGAILDSPEDEAAAEEKARAEMDALFGRVRRNEWLQERGFVSALPAALLCGLDQLAFGATYFAVGTWLSGQRSLSDPTEEALLVDAVLGNGEDHPGRTAIRWREPDQRRVRGY